MSLIKNWNIEDILTVALLPKMNWQMLGKTIEDFTSINDLFNSKFLPPYFKDTFRQSSLFEESMDNARKSAEKQIDICRKKGFEIVTVWDERYPKLLKEIVYPPSIIYVFGKLQPSDSLSISIVGTRKNTMYGKITAERFAEYFANRDIIVTSGMANGIDSISHNSALKAKGITYAVIASGLDCISSHYHRQNAKKIVDAGGAVISEYPCGVKAISPYFLQRNRIISGISKATIIIESAKKGGALNTARNAFEQQREVYAVPGRLSDAKSEGTNRLIKNNIASPALSPEYILDDLGFDNEFRLFDDKPSVKFDDPKEEKIFNTLNMEPMHVDEIASKSGINITELNVKLLEMEFKGTVKSLPGKHFIKS